MLTYGLAYVLDLIIGDPNHWYHPVRLIGSLIRWLEKGLLRASDSPFKKRFKGLILMITVVGASFLLPLVLLWFLFKINFFLGFAVEVWLIFRAFATRQLDRETKLVYKALKKGDLEEARKYISYLVSRDTDQMTEEEIVKAAIETIAENLGDGVVAPMIFAVIGGAPLAWAYKGANTLDSMVGYKNEKYQDYGFVSAKFDDLLNYIPARLSSIFILLAGACLRYKFRNGLKVLVRDRHNHASPNSAYPESAAAGLLDIQLGGKASYFGETSIKPTMGDVGKVIDVNDLAKASHLLYTTSFLAWIVLGALGYLWRGL